MNAIIVDDEPLMLRKFMRLSNGIRDLLVTGQFESAEQAILFSKRNLVDIAFIDIELPQVSGLELAKELRNIDPNILIVFITAHDKYVWDFNQIGGDYYILKPYNRDTLISTIERLRLLFVRRYKKLYVQMFGRFMVYKEGKPLAITGKAKEILALIMVKRGKEISNEEIYSTIWESRPYSNIEMTVYYNALRRLKNVLKYNGLSELLVSTKRGQLINASMVDCDYYSWQDKRDDPRARFDGEFLSEYSWGESILADILYNG